MRKLLLTSTTLLALAVPAKADVVLGGQNWTFSGADNLTLSSVVPGGNQPQNVQCVICGDNQPQQQADFGYTNFHNNGGLSDIRYFSTNVAGGGDPGSNTVGIGYNGQFLRDYLIAKGDPTLTFNIGIDVNDNNTAQILESFFLLNLTTHTVLSAFTTPTAILSQNNGTGFPDYTLGSFNITLGQDIHLGDQLIFFARISNASDGPDSFFLTPAAVPGPIVGAGLPGLVVACLGLLGLNGWRKRRVA
jgi:hypothetical protein